MKTIHNILTLGDPRLYENCEPVRQEELPAVMEWVK
jgi:peptide deformylase